MSRAIHAILLLTALGGCSSHNDQPGAVTADEARQLNDAAAMLDANSMDANVAAAMLDANSMDANVAAPNTNESDTQ